MNKFKNLFEPAKLNGLQLPNKIIMPAMSTDFSLSNGAVTQRMIDYYTARAAGGVGLIIVEIAYVNFRSKGHLHMLSIDKDSLVPGLKKMTDSVHAVGGKIGLQISHHGRRAKSTVINAMPVSSSTVPALGMEVPRALNIPEIQEVVEDFGQAARRAKEAGFDALEVHMAHGYLVDQFLSPYINKRTDEYGKTTEGRAKFAVEIVQRIRKEVGPAFPILVKLCASEFVPGGITVDLCKEYVGLLEKAGIDGVVVSGGILETAEYIIPPMAMPRGLNVERTRAIKAGAKVPIIAVGRINNPELAEEILENGDADFIAMGRSLIADPELPNKAREMRLDEIRPCISCNQACAGRTWTNTDLGCLANPVTGRETQVDLSVTSDPKNIMIIGGGPAGLTAAGYAAKKGHNVTLYEAGDKLGGKLVLAAIPPFKSEITRLVDFLDHDVRESGVKIVTNHKVVAGDIAKNKPDVVIMATGSVPLVLNIPGVERCISAEDCLTGRVKVSGPCVIIGGGDVGCETAHFLAEQGVEVTILEMLDEFARELERRQRKLQLQILTELGVQMYAYAKVTAIKDGVVELDRRGLNEKITGVKEVVMAAGYRNNAQPELNAVCEKIGIPIYTIGDSLKARDALTATHEGLDCVMAL